jgi:6-phosphogluconolactonase
MQTQKIIWRIFDSPDDLTQAAVDAIVQCATEAIAERGRFLIALSGGKTPRTVYQMLCQAPTDWSKWHVFYGDERCLPPEDDARNSLMASQALLDHVPIPAEQIHTIPAEMGAADGAAAYCATLEGVETFDLVLLGMGEDGHTASLFPGHTWDHNPPTPAISVKHAPKPPAERISLSASRLSDARRVIFLVTGAGKRHAVSQWRGSANMPVKAITPLNGADIFVDAAANEAL